MQGPLGPIEPLLARLDPLLQTPIPLSAEEFANLVDFVRYGLLDPRILPERLKTLVPKRVPSGRPTLAFEFEWISSVKKRCSQCRGTTLRIGTGCS